MVCWIGSPKIHGGTVLIININLSLCVKLDKIGDD